MTLGTEWCTIEDVQALLAEPYATDEDITTAIVSATSALGAAFCLDPLDVDPEDTYPDDWKVRQGCAILAAQVIVAPPMTGSIPPEAVEGETIGGYSYRTRAGGRTAATALRIDGAVKDLVDGYLCPTESGIYEIETLKYRHDTEEADA